ncbi:hypothetical protein JYP52_21345 [Nitratireductor aquibiodomus]|uniref:hypothetical protein n=1 Tax=Nitratireductor TaxID=245876 RepID=UPI000DE008A5|nr:MULTISPECIES: hypothetical protein [Nitratireductor]MBN7763687.1 hypothetical protein [Nitratireductor aquibiodomus]
MTDQPAATQKRDTFGFVRKVIAFAKWVTEFVRNLAVAGALFYLAEISSSMLLRVAAMVCGQAIAIGVAGHVFLLAEGRLGFLQTLTKGAWVLAVGIGAVMCLTLGLVLGAGLQSFVQEIADAHLSR